MKAYEHSFTHSLIHSLTHLFIHSLHSLTHSLTHSSMHSLTHSLTHSSMHSFTSALHHHHMTGRHLLSVRQVRCPGMRPSQSDSQTTYLLLRRLRQQRTKANDVINERIALCRQSLQPSSYHAITPSHILTIPTPIQQSRNHIH